MLNGTGTSWAMSNFHGDCTAFLPLQIYLLQFMATPECRYMPSLAAILYNELRKSLMSDVWCRVKGKPAAIKIIHEYRGSDQWRKVTEDALGGYNINQTPCGCEHAAPESCLARTLVIMSRIQEQLMAGTSRQGNNSQLQYKQIQRDCWKSNRALYIYPGSFAFSTFYMCIPRKYRTVSSRHSAQRSNLTFWILNDTSTDGDPPPLRTRIRHHHEPSIPGRK